MAVGFSGKYKEILIFKEETMKFFYPKNDLIISLRKKKAKFLAFVDIFAVCE